MLSALRAPTRAIPVAGYASRAYATLLDAAGAGTVSPASGAPIVGTEGIPKPAEGELAASECAQPLAVKAKEPAVGRLRPHLGIEVNPNHGLYAFFRKTGDEFSPEGVRYETIEPALPSIVDSGRAWEASELRRKSFRDLHILWYLVLRERNLLATQREEARRMGIANTVSLSVPAKMTQCRKTMARIKYVLNERRLAYEGALRVQATQRKKVLAERERSAEDLEELQKMRKEALALAQEDFRRRYPEHAAAQS